MDNVHTASSLYSIAHMKKLLLLSVQGALMQNVLSVRAELGNNCGSTSSLIACQPVTSMIAIWSMF